jgi:hypothetical protein
VGYFLSGLIFVYCLSGIALNHVNDWNPDFVIHKQAITLPRSFTKEEVNDARIAEFNALVGEPRAKIYDFPTPTQVKIYYENASLLLDLAGKTGVYESIQRRPLFHQVNALHRNSLKGWKWASDVFGILLLFITASGWFILKGKNGLGGRGKWLILAGILPPVVAAAIFEWFQK